MTSPAPGTHAIGPIVGAGWATSPGHRRTVNEDAVLAGPHWFCVADGMGGHRAGDVAATLVVDVLAGHAAPGATVDTVRHAVTDANRTVHAAAAGPRSGMGSTVVGAAPLTDGGVAVFHVGDSRCYRLHDGELTLLTTDHTAVQDLVVGGLLDPADALTHRLRHVVTRGIGIAPAVVVDVTVLAPPAGRLLLCSDGLSGELAAPRIGRVLAGVRDPGAAARRLVDLVLAGPARDNVTALVVDIAAPAPRGATP